MEKLNRDALRASPYDFLVHILVDRTVPECNGDLLFEIVKDVLDQHRDAVVIVVAAIDPVAVIARKQDLHQLGDDIDNGFLIRLFEYVGFVDRSALLVIPQDFRSDLPDSRVFDLFHAHNLIFLSYSRLASSAVISSQVSPFSTISTIM